MTSSKIEYANNPENHQTSELNEDVTPFKFSGDEQACPIEAKGFSRQPIEDRYAEAKSFFEQVELELSRPGLAQQRLKDLQEDNFAFTKEELTFGARVAWRNSIRCVGRMFWPSLHIFDARDATSLDDVFDAILHHLEWSTNEGDLRPAISVFRPGEPELRILNGQLILYAGYRLSDGTIKGDPKNIQLTDLALDLGWKGNGTDFDVLPLILRRGTERPEWFDIPKSHILEVHLRHPDFPNIEQLGLKWFALPAVASMALDMGGSVFSAAPTSGIYQGTEIGSFNLGDPKRYNKLADIAQAVGIDTSHANPLWRDQALVEINRTVLWSFKADGVRIMDHHALSESFKKFTEREKVQGRAVHGHWPWIVPPMSSNLSWIWHEEGFKKTILKPGYFYQRMPEDLDLVV